MGLTVQSLILLGVVVCIATTFWYSASTRRSPPGRPPLHDDRRLLTYNASANTWSPLGHALPELPLNRGDRALLVGFDIYVYDVAEDLAPELRDAVDRLGLLCTLGVQPCTINASAPSLAPSRVEQWNNKQVDYLGESILLLKILYSGRVTPDPRAATLFVVPTFAGTVGHLRYMFAAGRHRAVPLPPLPWLNATTAPAHVFLATTDRAWLPPTLFHGPARGAVHVHLGPRVCAGDVVVPFLNWDRGPSAAAAPRPAPQPRDVFLYASGGLRPTTALRPTVRQRPRTPHPLLCP